MTSAETATAPEAGPALLPQPAGWTLPLRWLASLPLRWRWHRAFQRWADGDFGESPHLDEAHTIAKRLVALGFCKYNPPVGICYVHGYDTERCP